MNIIVACVVAVLLPAVVSFLKNKNWPSKFTFVFSLAATFAVVAIAQAVHGDFSSWDDFVKQASTVWATTQVVYQMYFSETNLNDKLTEIGVLPGPANQIDG